MYKQMITDARKAGKTTEQTMWQGIDRVEELLCDIKEAHKDIYWRFIRDTYVDIYGPHFDPMFAEYELNKMWYTDKHGEKHTGPHWTNDEVVTAWQGKTFHTGTTDCDKWVAANTMYADLCKVLDEHSILDAAYQFFFADEDCDEEGKIWQYYN